MNLHCSVVLQSRYARVTHKQADQTLPFVEHLINQPMGVRENSFSLKQTNMSHSRLNQYMKQLPCVERLRNQPMRINEHLKRWVRASDSNSKVKLSSDTKWTREESVIKDKIQWEAEDCVFKVRPSSCKQFVLNWGLTPSDRSQNQRWSGVVLNCVHRLNLPASSFHTIGDTKIDTTFGSPPCCLIVATSTSSTNTNQRRHHPRFQQQ